MVGGHRMGHVYIGAIGLILTYLFHDRKIAATLCQNCIGCGSCVKRCGQSALSLNNGRAEVDDSKCVLCAYCSKVCPMFAIKVI